MYKRKLLPVLLIVSMTALFTGCGDNTATETTPVQAVETQTTAAVIKNVTEKDAEAATEASTEETSQADEETTQEVVQEPVQTEPVIQENTTEAIVVEVPAQVEQPVTDVPATEAATEAKKETVKNESSSNNSTVSNSTVSSSSGSKYDTNWVITSGNATILTEEEYMTAIMEGIQRGEWVDPDAAKEAEEYFKNRQ